MAFIKGQSGNPGGRGTSKPWADALRRALARMTKDGVAEGLDKIADKVCQAASDGDKDAWKEIGDRMDGKAAQSIMVSGDPDAPLIPAINVTIAPKPSSAS